MNFPRILKKRKGYIDRIKPFMQKSVVKVLTGQRRVGKSFLLYQLIEEILAKEPDANIIYVNLEDFTFSSLQTAQGKRTSANCLIINSSLLFSKLI